MFGLFGHDFIRSSKRSTMARQTTPPKNRQLKKSTSTFHKRNRRPMKKPATSKHATIFTSPPSTSRSLARRVRIPVSFFAGSRLGLGWFVGCVSIHVVFVRGSCGLAFLTHEVDRPSAFAADVLHGTLVEPERNLSFKLAVTLFSTSKENISARRDLFVRVRFG